MENKRPEKSSRHPVSPTLYQLRKYFVYVLVGGLIISALIAIIAILIGSTTDIISKAGSTVGIIVLHSLVALAFISTTSARQPNRGSAIVVNTLFALTVLSLITAMLGTWEIITDSTFIARQYQVYFMAFITSVVIYGLFQAAEDDKSTVIARNTAIGSTLVAFILLLPRIYEVENLAEMYYRVLAANYIVVGVSIVITVIFHWYYMSRNPQLRQNEAGEKSEFLAGRPILRTIVIILGIFIGLPLVIGILQGIIRTLSY